MKKALKIGLIIVGVIGVLYLVYIFFMMPSTENSPQDLAKDYFENIDQTDICDTHFNPDTKSFCTQFQDLFTDQDVVVESTEISGGNVVITIAIGDNSEEFVVTFIAEDVSGIKGIFNSKTYLIDTIE